MTYDIEMNGHFTYDELVKAVRNAKCNKAPGCDEIPVDVLKNDNACFFPIEIIQYLF